MTDAKLIETSRTDALLDEQHGGIWRSMEVHGHQMSVPASFARQLERELRAAALRAGELEKQLNEANIRESTSGDVRFLCWQPCGEGRA